MPTQIVVNKDPQWTYEVLVAIDLVTRWWHAGLEQYWNNFQCWNNPVHPVHSAECIVDMIQVAETIRDKLSAVDATQPGYIQAHPVLRVSQYQIPPRWEGLLASSDASASFEIYRSAALGRANLLALRQDDFDFVTGKNFCICASDLARNIFRIDNLTALSRWLCQEAEGASP